MKHQIFTERWRCGFQLRPTQPGMPATIYMTFYYRRRQHRFSTGVKVDPSDWDGEQGLAAERDTADALTLANNRIVNKTVRRFRAAFADFVADVRKYPPAGKEDVIGRLRGWLEAPAEFDAGRLMDEAFESYYTSVNPSAKASTRKQKRSILASFGRFLETTGRRGDPEVITQKGLNDYKAWLTKRCAAEHFGYGSVNEKCCIVATLINRVITQESRYSHLHAEKVSYTRIADPRESEERGRFALSEAEMRRFAAVEPRNEREGRYQRMFLLQCATGLRVADLFRLISGDYEDRGKTIQLHTRKRGITATLLADSRIRGLMQSVAPISDGDSARKAYTMAIRAVARRAGLTRRVSWRDSRGRAQTGQLCDTLVSHDARHTFITAKLREGVPYDTLILMTGHKDEAMIRRVYSHLTQADKASKVAALAGKEKKESGAL